MSNEMDVPTFGVEEELLLVEAASGTPFMENTAVGHVAKSLGLDLELEITPCQIETTTPILTTTDELRRHIVNSRRVADSAAREIGGRVLACGVPPVIGDIHPVSRTDRYELLADNFGWLAHEQGICGCHVHVAVPDRAQGIAVSNRLRPWLPTLLALTANSAIHDSVDTGYCSWRSVLWSRWPSAGAPPDFSSEHDYEAAVARLFVVGAALDRGMIYWDIRCSDDYPTLEIRVADVPATSTETVLYATLVRALVMTELAASAHHTACPPPTIDPEMLRLSKWRAARDGLGGMCPDPVSGTMIAARTAIHQLLAHVAVALDVLGEREAVSATLEAVLASGNGAEHQRRLYRHSGIDAVVEHVAARTISDTL